MGVAAVMAPAPSCTCASIGENPAKVRRCNWCHQYWRGDKRLESVTKVIRMMWPIEPEHAKAPPEKRQNALERGIEVDRLFSDYVDGWLDVIPKGTRLDSKALLHKLKRWWDTHKHHPDARSQVILADNEIAGTCDILDGDVIYDLKCTYKIEQHHYPLQLAAYGELHFATFGRPAKALNIIHISERFPEPKIIKVDMMETLKDWMTLREMWKMVRRRTQG